MKNKHFTYINTSDRPVKFSVVVLDKNTNQTTVNTHILAPKEILSDTVVSVKYIQGSRKNVELLDVKLDTGESLLKPNALGSIDSILKKSVIFDIETSGRLGRDSITQAAVYDYGSGKTTMFVPEANALLGEKPKLGEAAYKSRGSILDPNISGSTFRDIKYSDTLRQMALRDPITYSAYVGRNTKELVRVIKSNRAIREQIEDEMIRTDKFQAVQVIEDEQKLIKAGVGVDGTGTALSKDVVHKRMLFNAINTGTVTKEQLIEQVEAAGYDPKVYFGESGELLELKQNISIRKILQDDLPKLLKGKVTWIANASFESGEFGGHIDAYSKEAFDALNVDRATKGLEAIDESDFVRGYQYGRYEKEIEALNIGRTEKLQTKNPFFGSTGGVSVSTGKPFFVTGVEFSRARAQAQKSGDWSGMYEALIKYTKEGDVRDVLDIPRTQQSMLIKQGLITNVSKPAGLGVEVQARLYSYAAAKGRGEADAMKYLTDTKELHAAFADARISEEIVLSRGLRHLEAIDEVMKGTDVGKQLLTEAQAERGLYYEAQQYAGAYQALTRNLGDSSDSLIDVLYKQRAGRDLLQLAEEGTFETREYKPGLGVVQQARKVGDIAITEAVPIATSTATRHSTLSQFMHNMGSLIDYESADRERILQDIEAKVKPMFDSSGEVIEAQRVNLAKLGSEYSESASAQIKVFEARFGGATTADQVEFDATIKRQATVLKTGDGRITRGSAVTPPKSAVSAVVSAMSPPVPPPTPSHLPSIPITPSSGGGAPPAPPAPPPPKTPPIPTPPPKLPSSATPPVKPSLASAVSMPSSPAIRNIDDIFKSIPKAGYAGLVLGLAAFSAATPKREASRSLLTPTYEQFLEAKTQEYGSEEAYKADLDIKYGNTIEGMSESGVAAFMRKLNTDFGSPYQGMGYSSSVLEDHNLRRERQNYINRQFMLRHFSEQGDIGLFFKKHIDSAFRRQYGISVERPTVIPTGSPIDPERYSSLKGKNLVEYNIDPTQITVEDADTITVNRGGGLIDPLSKFMGTTGQAKFRLAGIDAPETAHEYRAAQPYAEAAKQIAKELLENAKEVKVVTEPGDSTYGRQVGVVYVDGKNLNLELLRRGAAAYLPYKGKGKQPIYDQKAFEMAEAQAYEARKGMWSEAYFQAYKEITKVSGQTVTFNMLNDPAKVVSSSNMMSMFAEMNKAQRQGYVNKEELEILGKKIGSLEKPFADDPKFSAMNLETYGEPSNSITSILDQQKYEIGRLMRTRGSDRLTEKMKVGNVSQNNVELAKMTTSDSVYESEMNQKATDAKVREIQSFKRKQAMAAMQQNALRNQFNSPIGHYRM